MPQPFHVDDLYLHRSISSLHCVPQAPAVVCAVRRPCADDDSHRSEIRTFPLDDRTDGLLLCESQGLDTSPRWSPDGQQVAFISDRHEGTPQVFVVDRNGGTPRQLSRFEQSAMQARWAPDGQWLAVTAAVAADPDLRGRPGISAPAPRPASAPEVAWRLPYKQDGVGYLLQRQVHLFAVPAAGGQARQITQGAFDVLAFDISPDGQRIAYVRSREGRFAHRYDLWLCRADGSGHRRLTAEYATVMQPAWSPDGSRIAFSGAATEGDAQTRLLVMAADAGTATCLAPDELEVADPETVHWSEDGRHIVLVRAHRGRHAVVSVDAGSGSLHTLLSGDRQFGAFACTPDRLVYTVDHPAVATEIWSCPQPGDEERQLSNLNPWWAERTPLQVEAVAFEVPDGLGGSERIEGWLMRAEGSSGPQPLLDDMHGGPASYALLDFETNVFWQVLCARGWAVLALNAVGSSSFGTGFCQRLAGHWGELDLPQHLAAITQLQDRGVCDSRLAVSGKSYGGYLSCWATGHTDLFQAAVVMAPVGNLETHYGTSDGGYYADPFYLGDEPGFDRRLARQLSPIQHVEKSRTPTLFLQGKEDERCPKCQSEELFVSLMRAGDTPTELVLYPNEGHGFLGTGQPACRRDAATRVVDWLLRHVHGLPPAPEGNACQTPPTHASDTATSNG